MPNPNQKDVVDSTNQAPDMVVTQKSIHDMASKTCSICHQPWKTAGEHRLVSLKCGHLFGYNCVAGQLKAQRYDNRFCPTCSSRAELQDIRMVFGKNLAAVDLSSLEKVHMKIEMLEVQLYVQVQTNSKLMYSGTDAFCQMSNINLLRDIYSKCKHSTLPAMPTCLAETADAKAIDSTNESQAEPKEDTSTEAFNITCPICLDSWTNAWWHNHRITSLKCGHIFGYQCIKKWLEMEQVPKMGCPICKTHALVEDIREIYPSKLVPVTNSHRKDMQDKQALLENELNNAKLFASRFTCDKLVKT